MLVLNQPVTPMLGASKGSVPEDRQQLQAGKALVDLQTAPSQSILLRAEEFTLIYWAGRKKVQSQTCRGQTRNVSRETGGSV